MENNNEIMPNDQPASNSEEPQQAVTRIKKFKKWDQDVHMVSKEVQIIFAKACEMFITDLTMRSWHHAQENKRRILQKSDIAAAVATTSTFDFLLDITDKDDKDASFASETSPMMPDNSEEVKYCYPPGLVIGTQVANGSGMYPMQSQSGRNNVEK